MFNLENFAKIFGFNTIQVQTTDEKVQQHITVINRIVTTLYSEDLGNDKNQIENTLAKLKAYIKRPKQMKKLTKVLCYLGISQCLIYLKQFPKSLGIVAKAKAILRAMEENEQTTLHKILCSNLESACLYKLRDLDKAFKNIKSAINWLTELNKNNVHYSNETIKRNFLLIKGNIW